MVKKVNLSSFISSIKRTFSTKSAEEIKNQKFLKSIGESIKDANADEFVPNFIQREGDHLGITSGKIKFFAEDIEKMKKMNPSEVAKYEDELIDKGKYNLEDLQ